MSVAAQIRQSTAFRHQKLLPCELNDGFPLPTLLITSLLLGKPFDQRDQAFLKFPTKNGISTKLAQKALIHRRVQPIETQMSTRIQLLDPLDDGHGNAGSRMHGN